MFSVKTFHQKQPTLKFQQPIFMSEASNEEFPWDVPQKHSPRVIYGCLIFTLSTISSLSFTFWTILPLATLQEYIPENSDIWEFIPDKKYCIVVPTILAGLVLVVWPLTIIFNRFLFDQSLNGKVLLE